MPNVLEQTFRFLSTNTETAPPGVTTMRYPLEDRRYTGHYLRLGALVSLAILISGCVTPLVYIEPPESWVPETSRVLLMPVDTRIHVITTGGTREERADWTEQSRSNLSSALREDLSAREIEIVSYREFGATVPWDPDHAPMIKLHQIVASLIDLRDGNIVWFGTALGSAVDTREQGGAEQLVEVVLGELPL